LTNRSKDRRARSRKHRPDATRRPQADGQAGAALAPKRPANVPHQRPKPRKPRPSPAAPTYGEPPQAPWHPLPLSELLILVGAIATVVGFATASRHGISNGGPALLAGLAAVAIGTIEVTLREHLSGYRSHTIMLALLPVLIFHSLALLAVSQLTPPPRLLNVGLLAIDIAMFFFLFRLLRARFLDARHARVIREG
jgi:hypothetical protein